MTEEFITKILPPMTQAGLIERVRLHTQASGFDCKKGTILIAPAGYGKTVTMTQLAKKIGRPLAWYFLDSYDNDPVVFFRYLITAIRQQLAGFGQGSLITVERGDFKHNIRFFTAALINELTLKAKDGLTLVLDDFHLINNQLIHHFVQEFLEHFPPKLHILIASRTQFPFSLTKMLLAEEITVLGVEALRFDLSETKAYLEQFSPTRTSAPHRLKELQENTEGWPVALRLAVEAQSPIATETKNTKVFFDYLAIEVLDKLPLEIRRFLLTTSVLETLTPDLCNQLLDRQDSGEILSQLVTEQLFITPLSGKKDAYRYHQLFREFLHSRLGRDYFRLIHQVGALLMSRGEFEHAVRYFIAANAEKDLVQAIVKAGRQALNSGKWQTVLHWLEAVPFEQQDNNPWLLLYRAEIDVYRGCIEEAEKWVKKAFVLFTAVGNNKGLAQTKILRARVLRCRGRFFESLDLLRQIEGLIPGNDDRLDLLMEQAVSLYLTGNYPCAEKLLLEALDKAEKHENKNITTHIFEALGNVYYIQGDYPRALHFFKKGIAVSPEGFLPGYHTQDHMSIIYQDLGELDKAIELAKRNVIHKGQLGLVETLPSAYTHLAAIYADAGCFPEAETCFQKAITIIIENNGEPTYLALSLAFYGRCLWLQGKLVEAKAKVEESLAIVEIRDSLCYPSCQAVGGLVLYQAGEIEQGEQVLLEARFSLEKMGFKKAEACACQSLAAVYFSKCDKAKFLEYATRALTLSAKVGYIQNFITCFEHLFPILQVGIENGIELSFIQRIMVRLGTRSHQIITPLLSHPDPEVRKRICAPLAEIRDEQARKALLTLTKDQNLAVRNTALNIVAKNSHISNLRPQVYVEHSDTMIKIHSLGRLRIFISDQEIPDHKWRTKKAKHLLAYLAHQGEPVSKEKIIDDLWPDTEGEDVSALFHSTMYRLRRALNSEIPYKVVTYEGGRYQLLPGVYEIDKNKFEALLQSPPSQNTTAEETISFLEETLGFYRGDYLEDLDYHWTLPTQERLRHLYILTKTKLAHYYLEKDNFTKTITHLNSLRDISYLSEEIYSLLMKAYAGLGDIKAIRKQFQEMTITFQEELGLAPSRRIVDLYYKLVSYA